MNRSTFTQISLLTALFALHASAQADDNDGGGKRHQSYFKWFLEEIEIGRHRLTSGRGTAILSPVDSPDRPPRHLPQSWYRNFLPYYSRVIPSSVRWSPEGYVPYYRGYCKTGKESQLPFAVVPRPTAPNDPQSSADSYGTYAGAPQDERQILRLGGEGPYQRMVPDIIPGGAAPPAEAVPAPPLSPNNDKPR